MSNSNYEALSYNPRDGLVIQCRNCDRIHAVPAAMTIKCKCGRGLAITQNTIALYRNPTVALEAENAIQPAGAEPSQTIADILAQRGSRYGDFSVRARIAQKLQDTMREQENWRYLSAVQKQALTVIADKIARILSGDPDYDDNWIDIQGYAKLVQDRILPRETPKENTDAAQS